jgi:hypothetical protein
MIIIIIMLDVFQWQLQFVNLQIFFWELVLELKD